MEQVLVADDDVAVGDPLIWDIYRQDGSLAFHKGYVFSSKGMLGRLIKNGLYREKPVSTGNGKGSITISAGAKRARSEIDIDQAEVLKSHAFSTVDSFAKTAASVLDKILSSKVQARIQLLKLNMNLGAFAKANQDMLIGAVHTYFPTPISSIQPVYCAFLCDLTAQLLGLDDERRASLRAAALTANVGMYHFQDRLNNQIEPLTDQQVESILLHPERGISLLEKVGVNDKVWLNTVAQHHEQHDGDGYPERLSAGDICTEAKIINIADRYLAMISKRAYSDTLHPKQVLKEIYQAAEGESKEILLAFIKTLGVYPPGTRVKLENGELAIVASRSGNDSTKCVVASVCDNEMGIYHEPIFRDTSDSNFAISNFHVQAIPFRVPIELIW